MLRLIAVLLISLLNFRFPATVPVNYIIRRRYSEHTLRAYRLLEKCEKRSAKLSCDLQFLSTCEEYNITPKFLQFRLYNSNLRHSSEYKLFQRDLLHKECVSKRQQLLDSTHKRDLAAKEFRSLVSWLDSVYLLQRIKKTVHNLTEFTRYKHDKKLKNLGFHPSSNSRSTDSVINLSDYVLSDSEKHVLSKGLKFVLGMSKPLFTRHFFNFEKFYIQLLGHSALTDSREDERCFKTQFRALTWSYFRKALKYYKSFTKLNSSDISLVKTLSSRNDIVISKADKGNAVVLLNRSDYLSKMSDILCDSSKFKLLSADLSAVLLKIETKINNFLRKLKKSRLVDESTYKYLFCSGAQPALMYGLPKIHKPEVPVRPILSAINTAPYKLAKYLVSILSPLTTNQYSIKDSFSFVKEVVNLNFEHCFMASFDIKSLFTNIPLDETISLTTNLHAEQALSKFDKATISQLLSLATKENIFLFDNQLYEQIDGVAMGSPLGPTLANIFLCFHENKWLSECPIDYKPLFYRRFVDDTFLIFKHESHVSAFLEYLNSKHPAIQFTHTTQSNNTLSFLDVSISQSPTGNLETSIYRKPTYTGLISLFSSFCPTSYKANLVLSLVHRAWNISSTYANFRKEMRFLNTLFTNNGYPDSFFWKHASKTVDRLYNPVTVFTVPRPKVFIPLDYFGYISDSFKSKFSDLLKTRYPQIAPHFAYRNRLTIGSFFRLKDRLPTMLRAKVVYQYTCSVCHDTYIGKTLRTLRTRAHEHGGLSERTGRPFSNPSFSAIRDHMRDHGKSVEFDSFQIKTQASNDLDLKILEGLFTYQINPAISRKETTLILHTLD